MAHVASRTRLRDESETQSGVQAQTHSETGPSFFPPHKPTWLFSEALSSTTMLRCFLQVNHRTSKLGGQATAAADRAGSHSPDAWLAGTQALGHPGSPRQPKAARPVHTRALNPSPTSPCKGTERWATKTLMAPDVGETEEKKGE